MGEWGYLHCGEDRNLASPDPRVRQRGIDHSRSAIDLAVQLGARYFNLCAAHRPLLQLPFPEAPISTLRQNFRESLASICEYAIPRNVTILLEPLNPYEGIPGVLTSVYEAIQWIEELGFDNLGIQPDIFHMNISEASITDALRAAGKRAKVIHMNETNHYRPGTGHADYPAIIRTLKQYAFDGYVTLYAPVISQDAFRRKEQAADRPDLTAALAEQLQFLQQIECAVDAQRAIYEV